MEKERDKNVSPVGWYVATEVLRFIPPGIDADDPRRRFVVWENLILVQADDPEMAYQKAMEGGAGNNGPTKAGRWQFEGLADLLPIYDKMEDGSEILWIKHKSKSVTTVKGMVKSKERLQVFSED